MTLTRTSRVLFVAALAALAAFAWIELPRRGAEQRARDAGRLLFAPFASAVDRVEIVRPSERIRIERAGTRWEVVEPVADAAEPARVATLIDAVARAASERNLGPAVEPARFGLAPPRAVVTLAASGDTLAYLELGAHTVDGAFVYARRRDGDVLLVPPAVAGAATLPAPAYRDQHLVRFDMGQVDAFTVRREDDAAVHWRRRAGDRWFAIEAGDSVAGDSVEVPTYLRRFRGMRVRTFVDPADTAGAFARAAGTVTLHKRAPAPAVTLRFVARAGGAYWCRVEGSTRVVEVDGDVPGALDASIAALRDRRLLHFSPPRARRIHVVTPDTSAVLVRAGDSWALPNPALGRIDPRVAADLVRSLRALRFRNVLATSARAVEPAAFTLVVEAEGDTILDQLRARRRDGPAGDWIATSRSSGVVAEVAAADLDAVTRLLRRLRTASRR